MGPEIKLYKKVKKKTPSIIWNRVENLTSIGMPDALAYNKNHIFFTVEFKVTRGNKLNFHHTKSRGILHIHRILLS